MTFEQAMERALTDAKYSYLTGRFEAIGDLIVSIIEGILRFLATLFNMDFTGFGTANTDIISGIFVVVFLFLLFISIAIFAHIVFKYKGREAINSAEIFDDFRNNRLSFDEIMALAKDHDAHMNMKEAIRYRYLGLILLFNAKGIVKVSDSMTGSAFYREAVKNMPSAAEGVKELINLYYSLFFGHKSVAQNAYVAHVETYENLIKEAQHL